MSAENVEIVRELMAVRERARESGKPPTRTDLVAPDFEIDMSRRVFNPAVYHGIDGLARLEDEIRDVWKEFRVVPEQFIDAGDRVVVMEKSAGAVAAVAWRSRLGPTRLSGPCATVR